MGDPYHIGRSGDVAALARLNPVDQIGAAGSTALLGAVAGGHREAVAHLLGRGASVDFKDPQGRSSLTLARDGAMIRLLQGAGADLNDADHLGQTVLHGAAQRGQEEVLKLLLELGADGTRTNHLGNTPLHLAEASVVPVLVPLLGVDCPNPLNASTPLMTAAAAGRLETLKALLELGADSSLQDNDKHTALDHAKGQGYSRNRGPPSPLVKPRGLFARVRGLFQG